MIIGLTGGIGSGKSLAGNYFSAQGIDVIDADKISRSALDDNSNASKIVIEKLGEQILDNQGSIDREKLRTLVFNSASKKEELEAIVHPIVAQAIASEVRSSSSDYCVIEVPLIYETNSMNNYDRIAVIDCDEATQISRVMQRDVVDQDSAKQILTNQCSRNERLSIANDVILNNGSKEELENRIKELYDYYLQIISR